VLTERYQTKSPSDTSSTTKPTKSVKRASFGLSSFGQRHRCTLPEIPLAEDPSPRCEDAWTSCSGWSGTGLAPRDPVFSVLDRSLPSCGPVMTPPNALLSGPPLLRSEDLNRHRLTARTASAPGRSMSHLPSWEVYSPCLPGSVIALHTAPVGFQNCVTVSELRRSGLVGDRHAACSYWLISPPRALRHRIFAVVGPVMATGIVSLLSGGRRFKARCGRCWLYARRIRPRPRTGAAVR
jgi:hypothetical protein